MLSRQTLLLKPMQTAASGFARVQAENGRTLVQLHARGLESGTARLFGYLEGGAARELGGARVNAHGEVSLEAEAPAGLRGLMLIGPPGIAPLLIALCGRQDAGGLLDVKNAALALCEKLKGRPSRKAPEPPPTPSPKPSPEPPRAAPPRVAPLGPHPAPLPREIFLPAIDPAPYVTASARPKTARRAVKPAGPPADRLPALRWPDGFAPLQTYFDGRLPTAILPWPGWRFVSAAEGLWLGMQAAESRVHRVAYVYAGRTPPDVESRCRPVRGTDGRTYRVLVQQV